MLISSKSEEPEAYVLWTTIPALTWLFPCAGHVGITYSNGKSTDFLGSNFVNKGKLGFGKPIYRYKIRLTPEEVENYNVCIENNVSKYNKKIHTLIGTNCHSYVCDILNDCSYLGGGWNQVKLVRKIFFEGETINKQELWKHWLPPLIIYGFLITIILYIFLY
uniref:LRAT domain-containing protein n=1 Tax=Parastrongyloides trichosuri TaxID=131310 RepID=A0A0N4Z152_PARTI